MRIKGLDIGVESVTTWTVADELHLPKDNAVARAFVPEARPLEDVLRRPSLDERLPSLLQPEKVDPALLVAGGLTNARQSTRATLAALALRSTGHARKVFEEAHSVLDADAALDEDVRIALAAILRG